MTRKIQYNLKPVKLPFRGTPITEDTFKRQGWTKVDGDDNDIFDDPDDVDVVFNIDEDDQEDFEEYFEETDVDWPDENALLPYPNQGEWEDEYHFWTLPLPKGDVFADTLTLISTTSDHWLPGFEKGQYVVELYMQNGLGTCTTEEEIEVLYKALTGMDIYIS